MKHCERCNKESNVMTMSYFNVDMVCMDCNKEERNHPQYEYAKNVELQECVAGNMNFEGVGLPEDLKKERQ